MIKVGCCGFPVKREDYCDKFDIVELQTTFYNLPKPSTAIRWHAEAPESFEYVVKTWQAITHTPESPTYRKTLLEVDDSSRERYGYFRPTTEVFDAWERTLEITRILKAKVVLFQCPPSFEESPENVMNMRAFFERIERGKVKHVWEPRGGWRGPAIRELCRELDLIHCVDPFADKQVYGEIAYFRLHGRGGYGYRYTDSDLDELLGLCPQDRDAYVMFNNLSMLEDALRFKHKSKSKE